MELIADGVLILAALAAMAYCMVLSRRLRRLTELDGGLGAAITALSREVDHLSGALAEAKTATTDSATDLSTQCRAAHVAARRLEALVKSANKAVLSRPKQRAETPARDNQRPEADLGVPESRDTPVDTETISVERDAQKVETSAALRSDTPAQTAEAEKNKAPKMNASPAKKASSGPDVVTQANATKTAPRRERMSEGPPPDSKLDAVALDQFIEAIMAKGETDDHAALARRLIKALATQDSAGAS